MSAKLALQNLAFSMGNPLPGKDEPAEVFLKARAALLPEDLQLIDGALDHEEAARLAFQKQRNLRGQVSDAQWAQASGDASIESAMLLVNGAVRMEALGHLGDHALFQSVRENAPEMSEEQLQAQARRLKQEITGEKGTLSRAASVSAPTRQTTLDRNGF